MIISIGDEILYACIFCTSQVLETVVFFIYLPSLRENLFLMVLFYFQLMDTFIAVYVIV